MDPGASVGGGASPAAQVEAVVVVAAAQAEAQAREIAALEAAVAGLVRPREPQGAL